MQNLVNCFLLFYQGTNSSETFRLSWFERSTIAASKLSKRKFQRFRCYDQSLKILQRDNNPIKDRYSYTTLSSLNVKGRNAMSWVKTDPNGVFRGSRRVSRMLRIQPAKAGTRNLRFRDKIVSVWFLYKGASEIREMAVSSIVW